ncbi:MAG: selenide, water dikinase SelD [Anaerolineae bacterium]
MLHPLQDIFLPQDFPDLLVGIAAPDDAAVYRLNDQQALVVTTDFFPPVVDDPYDYGAIAAANAMSDVFAMGGRVLFALNIAAFPEKLPVTVLSEIMRGGAEKVREAGAAIAGGHTITDDEPKYGLAVIGMVALDALCSKAGARPGDALVLSKALGTGVVTTALKRGLARSEHVSAAVASMARLNQRAAEAAFRAGAHATTDITGYSLLGHAHEMARLSNVDLEIAIDRLAWLPGTRDYAEQWIFPGGMANNRRHYSQWVTFEGAISEVEQALLFDPETSSGLLIAVPQGAADQLMADLEAAGDVPQQIGRVVPGSGSVRVVR